MTYSKFFVMMLISFFIMYLVMFLNITELNHYYTSMTRIYMAVLMVAPMDVVMMVMMGKMYPDKKKNLLILHLRLMPFSILPFNWKISSIPMVRAPGIKEYRSDFFADVLNSYLLSL